MSDLVERLRENDEMLRDGLKLPNLTAAWHNVVMKQAAKDSLEAADALASQATLIAELQGALKPFADAADRYDKFWSEETGGQAHLEGEDGEQVTFYSLGCDVDMVPLSDFRRALSALKGGLNGK